MYEIYSIFLCLSSYISSIGKGIPSKSADGELRNIVEISDEELEKLQNNEPLFRKLVEKKKYRVLNKLPENYRSPTVLVNEARTESANLKSENEELKKRIAELEELAKSQTKEKKSSKKNKTESDETSKTETSKTETSETENSETENSETIEDAEIVEEETNEAKEIIGE